jgi:hypothetical protein
VSRARAAMQEIANWLAMSPISDDRNNERADTLIVVHHLNNSRSQGILWLLEELNTPYRVETYRRDAKTNLAPSELRAVHPLGKSPVIQDGDLVLAESGAIIEYLPAGLTRNATATEQSVLWLKARGASADDGISAS